MDKQAFSNWVDSLDEIDFDDVKDRDILGDAENLISNYVAHNPHCDWIEVSAATRVLMNLFSGDEAHPDAGGMCGIEDGSLIDDVLTAGCVASWSCAFRAIGSLLGINGRGLEATVTDWQSSTPDFPQRSKFASLDELRVYCDEYAAELDKIDDEIADPQCQSPPEPAHAAE